MWLLKELTFWWNVSPPSSGWKESGGIGTTLVLTSTFSEMPVFIRATWRHIPEDDILHSHRHENFKFYAHIEV
jgi:hypothetical protein